MVEIPTMACPDPLCRDGVYHERQPCHTCTGTGRIPRPPLTPEQIAALPDGARVVVEWHGGTYGVATVDRDEVGIWLSAGATVDDAHRVWLADDGGEG